MFFGGAGGPGKSFALLMAALQFFDVPGYAALLVRQTYSDLNKPGALMDVAHQWLDGTPARWDAQSHTFSWPGGGKISFGYCRNFAEVQQYRGAQYQFIGVDELTLFAERVYRFLFSRLRRPAVPCLLCGSRVEYRPGEGWVHSPTEIPDDLDDEPTPLETDCVAEPDQEALDAAGASKTDATTIFDVPLRMRGASNPGGPGHAWCKERFIEPETRRRGVRFLAAYMTDNPNLDVVSYLRSLRESNPIDYLRIAEGDWDAVDPGQWFHREQFPVVKARWASPDRDIAQVRRWDLASSEVDEAGDPDWTAGVLMARNLRTGRLQIQHIARKRVGPTGVEKLMLETAEADGKDVPIIIEQEPGSNGKILISGFRRGILAGYNVRGLTSTGKKESRIRVLVPLAEEGSIEVVEGAWNQEFFDEAEAWRPATDETHDDQLDAAAAANADLSGKGRARIIR